MQTLTAGSFLNLENNSTVEALKFTARRLAEHSASVIAENLNVAALENLAFNLWEKAEYMTRETEQRRLKEIFAQNFSERFRELKPDFYATEKSSFEARPNTSTVETAASEKGITVDEGKSDEFLGFVKSEESLEETSITSSEAKMTTAPEETGQRIAQTTHETISKTLKSENQAVDVTESEAEKSNDAKPQTDSISAKSESSTTGVSNNNTPATNVKESFDFEKCTINLNLTLLPTESGGNRRKAIISAASHDLPPEIDFLEIAEGEDLTSIAELVQEKLKRFQQTLPVKYIEQLRASKTKAAKKSSTTKANTAPTKTEKDKPNNEIESGEQKAQDEKSIETEKTQALIDAEENKTSASSEFMPTVNQTNAVNEIQQSLF